MQVLRDGLRLRLPLETGGVTAKDAADRWRPALSRKRITDAARAAVLDPDERRSRVEVYRTDVEFTGTEAPLNRLPPKGSPDRAALVERVDELKQQGLSHAKIGLQLGFDLDQINRLCVVHGIRRRR